MMAAFPPRLRLAGGGLPRERRHRNDRDDDANDFAPANVFAQEQAPANGTATLKRKAHFFPAFPSICLSRPIN